MTLLNEIKVNTFDINEKMEVLSREIIELKLWGEVIGGKTCIYENLIYDKVGITVQWGKGWAFNK